MNPLRLFTCAVVALVAAQSSSCQARNLTELRETLKLAMNAASGDLFCVHTFYAWNGVLSPASIDISAGCGLVATQAANAVLQRAAADNAQFGSLYFAVEQRRSGALVRVFAVPARVNGPVAAVPLPGLPLIATGDPRPGSVVTLQAPAAGLRGPATVLFATSLGAGQAAPLLPRAALDPASIGGVAVEPTVGAGVGLAIPNDPALSGLVLYAQGVHRMVSPLAPFAMTDALQIVVQ